jgi:phosphate transport system protein
MDSFERKRQNGRPPEVRFYACHNQEQRQQGTLKNVNKFFEELEHLKQKLLEMSSLVEAGIERSIRAVVHRDRGAADDVLKNEDRINGIELEIDALAINLLALHQPMASDLRFIVAALKINSNLERMGDISVNIAHTARSLIEAPSIEAIIDIPLMARLVQSMVRKSLDAFVASDTRMARNVLVSDDAVDSLRTACFGQLVSFMERDSRNVPHGLRLLTVARSMERLADHSTNIAEHVLFYVNGIDVRHNSEQGKDADPG